MNWSAEQRQAHLHHVLCMSRFLVRPATRCRNLASRVLGMVMRRLADDFEGRCCFRPWLVETYTAPGHDGASLRAANFLRLGKTAGTGRDRRPGDAPRSVKTLYVHELDRNWRGHLGVARIELKPALGPGEGLDIEEWAENEFGGNPKLGDRRMSARVVKIANSFARSSGETISSDSWAESMGLYRFTDHPDEARVSPENIMAKHRERTVQRMRGQCSPSTILLVQDETVLNYANLPSCVGLEVIESNQTSAKTMGIRMLPTLAVSDAGIPLGLTRLGFVDPSAAVDKTERWIAGLRDANEIASRLPRGVQVVSVMDREADIFQMFDERRRLGRVHVLVRARHSRILGEGQPRLFDMLRAAPSRGELEFSVRRTGDGEDQSGEWLAEGTHASSRRTARAELRWMRVTLPSKVKGAAAVDAWAVHLRERSPPAGEKPVEWFLLTSMEIDSLESAVDAIRRYRLRWRIEDCFRVLKSGCGVGKLRFRTALRLQRAIAIKAVVAWRIMLMTLLGREAPDCDARVLFGDDELRVLSDLCAFRRFPPPKTLGDAVRAVAAMGGHQGGKRGLPPGHQVIWRGYARLSEFVRAYRLLLWSLGLLGGFLDIGVLLAELRERGLRIVCPDVWKFESGLGHHATPDGLRPRSRRQPLTSIARPSKPTVEHTDRGKHGDSGHRCAKAHARREDGEDGDTQSHRGGTQLRQSRRPATSCQRRKEP